MCNTISPQDGSTMDGGAGKVKVNISVDIDKVLLVASLDFATLLPETTTFGHHSQLHYIRLVLH